MATIVTKEIILFDLEKTHGPIDSITIERNRNLKQSRDNVRMNSPTCKNLDISTYTIGTLWLECLETMKLLVTGFMGREGAYNIKVRDAEFLWSLESLKKLHIEIYQFDQVPYGVIPFGNIRWKPNYTVTGENISTTSLANIFLPSLETLFIKGLFFQEDFSFSTSFPKAYRMDKSMVFDHCIFHPCIIPHITAECLVLQHCYLVIGNGVDEYNLLHITFSNIDFLLHKVTFANTLKTIDGNSFPTTMQDVSKSEQYLFRSPSISELMNQTIRRQREEREEQERQQIG